MRSPNPFRASSKASALAVLLLCLPAFLAAAGAESYSGMVWENHGRWFLNGSTTPIRLGESVPPGALLNSDATGGAQSAVILLPDGQRLLCECYDAQLCSQGFRVPAIKPAPSPAAWDMFVGVRNTLLLRPADAPSPFAPVAGRAALAANVETVLPLIQPNEISIASSLAVLPSGSYTVVVTDDAASPAQTPANTQPLEWVSPKGAANVRVAGPGVYRMRVADVSLAPRMQIEVLVVAPDALAKETAGLKQARETVLQWSSTHQGWAVHDFLRAYLESRATPSAH